VRQGKAAVEKYSLQVLLSFRCPQVNKTGWGSEVVVPALRRGNRKKPERNYVVSFPAITDAEHDEDDGRVLLSLGARWVLRGVRVDNEVIRGKTSPGIAAF
jgi:hypothetical protein